MTKYAIESKHIKGHFYTGNKIWSKKRKEYIALYLTKNKNDVLIYDDEQAAIDALEELEKDGFTDEKVVPYVQ